MRTVRIPADVDREDRLLGGLTARQLAWLSGGGLALVGLWSTTRDLLPAPVFAAAATPVAAVVLLLGLGRRDGLPADRLALAGLRHTRSPRRMVPAPEGVLASPEWARSTDAPAPLPFPVVGTADDGVLDLGAEGRALVCRASSLNFGLRTPDEQLGLVAAFARWLNSLDAPVQFLVRAERVDAEATVASLRAAAAGLPHPALETAAREHAAFVADLAGRRDVLRRVVFVVFRQAAGPGADDLLCRRAEEAGRALAAAGVVVSPLSEDEALAALARAADPDAPPRPTGLARPGTVIEGSKP
jgi:PrgI family protein